VMKDGTGMDGLTWYSLLTLKRKEALIFLEWQLKEGCDRLLRYPYLLTIHNHLNVSFDTI
jgi:hypothetical protein